MRLNIHLKILTVFFLAFLIFVFLFYHYLKVFENDSVYSAGRVMSQGVLNTLEATLRDKPESQWENILTKKTNTQIYIKAIHALTLSQQEMHQLNQDELIFSTGSNYLFLNLGMVQHTAYKKIGETAYALAYDFSDPTDVFVDAMRPALKLIIHKLQIHPKNKWDEILLQIEKTYGFPIKIYPSNDKRLPRAIRGSLSRKGAAIEGNPGSSKITTLFYAFGDGILKIGPLNYLPITGRISDVMFYFVVTFFIIALSLIIFLSLLFVKNIKTLYEITEKISHGDFHLHAKMSPTSVLYKLYQNIILMGKRLSALMESHKQLCRFVAHEMRTPLSTMQMAIDRIKHQAPANPFISKQVTSIQEDMRDMNALVSTFLIYSKMQSTQLKVKKTPTDIAEWLKQLLSAYDDATLAISFYNKVPQTLTSLIDTHLLTHAVTNLISNALKFAKKRVALTLSQDKNHIIIHVDDDGPGLRYETIDDIFAEYTIAEDVGIGDKHIGLGLAIVKKVITLHDGEVLTTHSPLLQGARFTILLPYTYP